MKYIEKNIYDFLKIFLLTLLAHVYGEAMCTRYLPHVLMHIFSF
jgi:hypothetical protein